MRKALLVIGGIVGVIVIFAAALATRERTIGDGPIVTGARPQGTAREIAFVADAVGGTITVVDVAAREVVGTLDIIPDGPKVGLLRNPLQALVGQKRVEARGGRNFAQDTDISPDGRVLYVSRGHLADVVAFDLADGRLLWRRAIGVGRSDHMALTPDGRYLFVADIRNARVKRIDTHTGKIDGEFVSGVFPHDIQFSHDGTRVYNASLGNMLSPEPQRDDVEQPTSEHGFAYQLTLADVNTLEIIERYRFPRGIRPFHLDHEDSQVFAQLSNTHGVVRYDLARRAVVEQLDLPIGAGVGPSDWDFEAPHHGLAMTSDGKLLCVAARASDYAGIVATDPLASLATVAVSDAPSWSVINAADELCLTANTRADEVSIVSLADRTEIVRLPTGRGPKHITIGRVPVAIIDAIRQRHSSPPT